MKIVIAALGAVAVCRAVSCVGTSNCQRLSSSSVFFVGKAIETKATGRHRFTGSGMDPQIFSVRYQVVRAFAGVTPGQIVVVEDTWAPEPGRQAFVEAYQFQGKIETSVCSSASLGERLQQFLERRAAGDFAVKINGPVQRQGRSVRGSVRFAPMPPGRYVVEVEGEGYEAEKTAAVDVIVVRARG